MAPQVCRIHGQSGGSPFAVCLPYQDRRAVPRVLGPGQDSRTFLDFSQPRKTVQQAMIEWIVEPRPEQSAVGGVWGEPQHVIALQVSSRQKRHEFLRLRTVQQDG